MIGRRKRGRGDHAIEEEEEVKEEEEEEVFRPGPIRFMIGIPRLLCLAAGRAC